MNETPPAEGSWELNNWDRAGMAGLAVYLVAFPLLDVDSVAVGAGLAVGFLVLIGGAWLYALRHRPPGPRKPGPLWLIPLLALLIAPIVVSDPPDSAEDFALTGLLAFVFFSTAMAEVTVRRGYSPPD